jgi:hypothetical protein
VDGSGPGGLSGQSGQSGRSEVVICANLRPSAAGLCFASIRVHSRLPLRLGVRFYSLFVLGANTLTMDSKMVSLAFL